MNTEQYQKKMTQSFNWRYDNNQDAWSADPGLKESAIRLTQLLKGKGNSVLDIGVGVGNPAQVLLESGQLVTGIDLYEHGRWKDLQQQWGENIKLIQGDFNTWYCESSKFDAVMDNGCMHHQHPSLYSTYLEKVYSLLKSNGYFVLNIYADMNEQGAIGKTEYTDHERICKYFTKSEISALLNTEGFSVDEKKHIYRQGLDEYYLLVIAQKKSETLDNTWSKKMSTAIKQGSKILFLFFSLISAAEIEAETPVSIAIAESKEIAPTREFPGRVITDHHITLSAEVGGTVKWIQPLGAVVKEGELLAQLDDSLLLIAKKKAEKALVDYKSRIILAKKRRDRHGELSSSNYVAQNSLDKLDSEISELTGQLQWAKLELDRQKQWLRRTRIKAPFSGRVTERLIKVGEWLSEASPILRIVDDKNLEVSIRVPSAFASSVNVGDSVSIRSSLSMIRGKVTIKTVQPDFKFYEIRVGFDSKLLPLGIPVNIGFAKSGFRTTQVVVPADALQIRNDKVGLFKISTNNQAVYTPVSTIAIDGNWAAIEGQVVAGDTVVVRGVERLTHGQTVKVLQ